MIEQLLPGLGRAVAEQRGQIVQVIARRRQRLVRGDRFAIDDLIQVSFVPGQITAALATDFRKLHTASLTPSA